MSTLLFVAGVLFALLWMAAPLVGVVLTWEQRRALRALRRRVDELEQRVAANPPAGLHPAAAAPLEEPERIQGPDADLRPDAGGARPEADGAAPEADGAGGPASSPPPAAPARRWELPSPERVMLWVAACLGGGALVLAALLALVAVVERGWLLPSLRVAGALVGGTAAWAGGLAARTHGHPWAGSALAGSGAGILFGGVWAGSALYGLVPDRLAWVLMVAITVLAALHAVRLADRLLAWLALLGGLLTPILLSQGENRPLALFAWLTLLGAGIVASAARRRWPALVAGAAVGLGALFIGWTGRWYAADQAPAALLGVGAMSLPFAVASASSHEALRRVSWASTVALCLLALPWLGPIDPVFFDPRSGERVVRHLPRAAAASALAVALLPLGPWLAARRGDRWQGGVAGALVAGLALAWAVLQARGGPPALAPRGGEPLAWAAALAGAGALALGAVVTRRRPGVALGLFAVPTAAGAALAVSAASGALHGHALAVAVAGVALAGFALARTSSGWVLAPALLGAALPLWAASADPAHAGLASLLGPTLLTLALYSQAPAVVDWRAHDRAALGTSAVSGIALLPALLAAWSEAWGTEWLGVVPALVAANTLVAAAALSRAGRLHRADAVFGLFVATALFGLSVAVPLQLGGRWLTIAWAIEMAGLAALAPRVRHPVVRGFAVLLACTLGVRLLLNPFAPAYGPAAGLPFVNWTAYTWGVPLVCLLVAVRCWPRHGRARALFGALAVLVGFALVEMQVRQLFGRADPAELGGAAMLEGMVRSVSWAFYGLAVLALGAARHPRSTFSPSAARGLRFAGFAFVFLAAIRVFAVDLWGLEGFARVGSVGGLAVTMLLAAFTFERLVRGSPRAEEA